MHLKKPETGLCITYDIKEMRNNTAKLEKRYKQRYIKTAGKEQAESWKDLQQRIHQGLKECYLYNPKKKTQTTTQYHQWGSKEEQKEMENNKQKDKNYKQKITILDNKTQKNLTLIQLAKYFSNWKQIIRVKKQNNAKIIYNTRDTKYTITYKPPIDHIERLEKAHKIIRRQKSKFTQKQLWAKFHKALEEPKRKKIKTRNKRIPGHMGKRKWKAI